MDRRKRFGRAVMIGGKSDGLKLAVCGPSIKIAIAFDRCQEYRDSGKVNDQGLRIFNLYPERGINEAPKA